MILYKQITNDKSRCDKSQVRVFHAAKRKGGRKDEKVVSFPQIWTDHRLCRLYVLLGLYKLFALKYLTTFLLCFMLSFTKNAISKPKFLFKECYKLTQNQ